LWSRGVLPIPATGALLRLASGERWRYGLVLANPVALAQALAGAGGAPVWERTPTREALYANARLAIRRSRLDQPWVKFGLLPVALALPAFRLHQHIAYGGGLGEYYTFGLKAYLTTFSLWWAAWAISVVLCAAALRAAIEAGTLLTVLVSPEKAVNTRRWLERLGLAGLYLGLPAWLLMKALGA
jgi:apolipoprotein N-acyltransferase